MTAAVALKYAGFVRIAAAQARRERGELYGRWQKAVARSRDWEEHAG